MGATMKTTYDKTSKQDGKAARDRLVAKARQPIVRDIARLNVAYRPRPRPTEYTELVPDTTEEDQ